MLPAPRVQSYIHERGNSDASNAIAQLCRCKTAGAVIFHFEATHVVAIVLRVTRSIAAMDSLARGYVNVIRAQASKSDHSGLPSRLQIVIGICFYNCVLLIDQSISA